MKLSLIQNNVTILFYSSLLLQVVFRIIIFYIHHYFYNGIGYTNLFFGYVWIFILIPLSLILGFLVIKQNKHSSWIKPLLFLIITLLIVIGFGFLKI